MNCSCVSSFLGTKGVVKYFLTIKSFFRLLIISFILKTLLFDLGKLAGGEIGCLSLSGGKGITKRNSALQLTNRNTTVRSTEVGRGLRNRCHAQMVKRAGKKGGKSAGESDCTITCS